MARKQCAYIQPKPLRCAGPLLPLFNLPPPNAQVGMSQMSAGSRTDVGAYHRDDNEATEKHLGDLAGQFSLMDHRTASEVGSWVGWLTS
jgi:hypothetical protein